MLVQGSPPPEEKEKSCIIKMGGDGRMDGGGVQEERDRQTEDRLKLRLKLRHEQRKHSKNNK